MAVHMSLLLSAGGAALAAGRGHGADTWQRRGTRSHPTTGHRFDRKMCGAPQSTLRSPALTSAACSLRERLRPCNQYLLATKASLSVYTVKKRHQ